VLPEIDDAGPPIAVLDAGVLDAGVVMSTMDGMFVPPPHPDAGSVGSDAGVGANVPAARSCRAGQQLGGYCWFLSALNQSCSNLCSTHGGYESSLYWIGSHAQGGALARCDALLTLLAGTGMTTAGQRTDGRGLGCHLYGSDRWWLYMPDFDPAAHLRYTRVVCSCFDD
jgi:hypothetical protein